MAEAFPEILRTLAALPANLVLDGELVVPDEYGRSDFEEVRRRNLCNGALRTDGESGPGWGAKGWSSQLTALWLRLGVRASIGCASGRG